MRDPGAFLQLQPPGRGGCLSRGLTWGWAGVSRKDTGFCSNPDGQPRGVPGRSCRAFSSPLLRLGFLDDCAQTQLCRVIQCGLPSELPAQQGLPCMEITARADAGDWFQNTTWGHNRCQRRRAEQGAATHCHRLIASIAGWFPTASLQRS